MSGFAAREVSGKRAAARALAAASIHYLASPPPMPYDCAFANIAVNGEHSTQSIEDFS
jgi:hypothetical protein